MHTAPAPIPPVVERRLDRIADGLVRRGRVHHALLAVETGDGYRWARAVGPDARPDSPCFVASITKRFVAALLLQAVERGELALDDRIVDVLGAEAVGGLHVRRGVDRTGEITLHHLATHTSGLDDFFLARGEGGSIMRRLMRGIDVDWALDDVLRIARTQGPRFAPQPLADRRQRARYSDTGFQLLIRALEVATGRTFGALVAERIAAPLRLADTWLPASGAGAAPLPLHRGTHRVDVPRTIAASNDLVSTLDDLLSFQRALLAGELHASPTSVARLTERANRLEDVPVLRYGLGTMTFATRVRTASGIRRVTLVGHSGSTGTWLFHCPELDLHLAGTVDQTHAQSLPFRVMARCVDAWRS